MIVGIPNAGQVNALATLNIRGERSVTCSGDFDLHPSKGPLPPAAPPICEIFRQLPDALEQAAELDAALWAQSRPGEDAALWRGLFLQGFFDTRDMRSTGGGDAAYDIDFPARDHLLVERLRDKGAIIFAKAVCTEYNGRAGDPGGRHRPTKVLPSTLGYQRSTWGGNPANPYDTTRCGFAWLELWFGRLRQHQSGDGEPRRGDASIMPRTLQPQCHCVDSSAQGDDRVQRRSHRRRHILRPHRHPRAKADGLRADPRCAEGSDRRLL